MVCETAEPWGRYSASGGLFHHTIPHQKGGGKQADYYYYIYSFGGDTTSDADGRGGVVRTNFRFNLETKCWERLSNSPTEIGYRATATQVLGGKTSQQQQQQQQQQGVVDNDNDENDENGGVVYVLFGADRQRRATNDFYRYSLLNDTWTLLNTTTTSNTALPRPRWKHAAVALDETKILITGGRGDGRVVYNDAWIFDTTNLSWTQLLVVKQQQQQQPQQPPQPLNNNNNTTTATAAPILLPPMYRHGMAYDPSRNVTWIYGGLDDNLIRYQSQLWKLDMANHQVTQVDYHINDNSVVNPPPPPPPRLASFAMEYIQELDVLLLWGGTCSDDSELHIYNIAENSWCRIFGTSRPDRRDAMIWGFRYPNFYIAQGDSICYNQQVLTISDVHVMNLQQQFQSSSSSHNSSSGNSNSSSYGWQMLYEPTNIPRGTGMEPYCDGSNAGNCQPRPILLVEGEEEKRIRSTCSADLLSKFSLNNNIAAAATTTSPPTPTLMPTPSANDGVVVEVGTSKTNTDDVAQQQQPTSAPTTLFVASVDTTTSITSQAYSSSPCHLSLVVWMFLVLQMTLMKVVLR